MMRYLVFLTFLVFLSISSLAEVKAGEATKEQEKKSAEEQSRTVAEDHEGEGAVEQKSVEEYNNKEEVEKLEVIGSHIKKTNIEGPSPVLVIDREQIEMSGYDSLADIFRELPIASQGSSSEFSLNADSASMTKTSLRGMTQDTILILMNGKRINPFAGTSSVDLTIIPISVIERVEILKDSASAIYGADAIGGVINIVTKKGDVGGQVNVQGSLVQRIEGNSWEGFASFLDFWNWDDTGSDNSWAGKGDKFSIDASYGGNADDINYLIGGQVRFSTPLYLRDRDFGRLPSAKDGSVFGSPGSWSDDDGKTWKAATDCPQENKKPKNGICGFDWSPYMQFTPQVLKTSAFGWAETQINDELNVSAQALYSYTRTYSIIAPAPDSFSKPKVVGKDADYRISVDTAQKLGLNASNPVTVLYRLVEEEGSGNREHLLNIHSYQAQLSATQSLLDTMELEGHFNVSGSYYSTLETGYVNKETLFNMMNEGTFNPFLPSGQKSDISKASYEPTQDSFSNLISFEPKLSGELAEFSGHQLMFAVGGLGAWRYYLQESDAIARAGKTWGGGSPQDGEANRTYGSFYGELSALFFEMAHLQVAARTDYYNDFGLAWQDIVEDIPIPFSPRVALSVQPIDEIKFRASWGLGFKVPSLADLYHSETIDHPSSRDFVTCTDEFKAQQDENNLPDICKDITQYHTFMRSNEDLQPEDSRSFNIGIVLEPVEKLSFSIDYYRIDQDNIAFKPELRDIIQYEAKHGADKLKQDTGSSIVRNPSGTIDHVVIVPVNMAQRQVQGLDLEMALTFPVEAGWDMGFSFQHSHNLYVEEKKFKGGDVENPVPWYEFMQDLGAENADSDRKNNLTHHDFPRWRNRAILSTMNKNMDLRFDLIIHNIPSRLQTPESEEDNLIGYYWQLDLRSVVGLTKDSRLTVGVKNILGFDRPKRDTSYSVPYSAGVYLDSNFYSMRGRSIDVRYSHDF